MKASPQLVSLENAPLQIIDGDRGAHYPNQHEFSEVGFCLFLNAGNVTKSGFTFGTCLFINESKDRLLRKGRLCRDDIVMTTRGTLGHFAFYSEEIDLENIRINSGMVLIRADQAELRPHYLYCALRSSLVADQINQLKSGVAQPQLPIRDLKKIKIPIPALDVQERIATLIGTYDRSITNNTCRIELLERSARLLFEEWFIRLRYPGHEHERIINGVPEGWQKEPLSRMCCDVRIKVHPHEVDPQTPYVGLEHIPRRSVTISQWGQAAQVESGKFKYLKGDILFAKIRPYFHKVGFALTDGITSSDTVVVRALKPEWQTYVLHLLSSDSFIALTSKTVKEGAKMPRADWKFLLKRTFSFPPSQLREHFDDYASPLLQQLCSLGFQNRKLSEARDLLLPRLMDGRIEV